MARTDEDRVGYADCPYCGATVGLYRTQKRVKLFSMCDGADDPDMKGCGTRAYLGPRPSADFIKQAAVAERTAAPAPDPQPETEDDGLDATTDTGEQPDDGADVRTEPKPERRRGLGRRAS